MNKTETNIDGLFIIENNCLRDHRGSFLEFWNKKEFERKKLIAQFLQDNISISKKNVIRGLHFQKQPYAQTKYVSVIKGKVLDVVVDIRKKSKTFGKHFKIELSEDNNLGLWISAGLAHGFLSLKNNTIFSYKCEGQYNIDYEYTINWNDPEIGIKWGIETPIVSQKDNQGISLRDYINNQHICA